MEECNLFAQVIDTTKLRIIIENPRSKNGFTYDLTDSIFVKGYDTDSNYVFGANDCNNDSLIIVYLEGDTLTDLLNCNLEFQLKIESRGCYAQLSNISKSAGSTSKALYIDNLETKDYYAYYENTTFCDNSSPEPLTTNIPIEFIRISHPKSLWVDSLLAIHPELTPKGAYGIEISSEYCIPTPMDLTNIVMGINSPVDLPDTLVSCAYGGIPALDISNYYLVNPIEYNNQSEFTVSQSGYYLLSSDSVNVCNNYDSVYVKVVPPANLIFSQDESCDNVSVNLFVAPGNAQDIQWSTGGTGNTAVVPGNMVVFVKVTDEYGCIYNDSVYVNFNPMVIESASFEKQDADCWKDGEIALSQINVVNNKGNYSTSLVNSMNGSQVSDLNNVPAGIYKIQVTDSKNCRRDYPDEIVIKQKCLEDNPVFSPNSDGIEDQYFIPYEGSVKIYNSEGKMIKSFSTPAYWDGTDSNGNPLSMGNYVIITDKGNPVNITIVR